MQGTWWQECSVKTTMQADFQSMLKLVVRRVQLAAATSGSLTSSAANFSTAVNGASSGTLNLRYTTICNQNTSVAG